MKEKILIKCDKCGSTNVVDQKIEKNKVTVFSMDDYIEENKSHSLFSGLTAMSPIQGTSHMDKRVLKCRDCDFTRVWDQIVYT